MQENDQCSYHFLILVQRRWPRDVNVHLVSNRFDSKIVQVWNWVFSKYLKKYLCDRSNIFRMMFFFTVGNRLFSMWNSSVFWDSKGIDSYICISLLHSTDVTECLQTVTEIPLGKFSEKKNPSNIKYNFLGVR